MSKVHERGTGSLYLRGKIWYAQVYQDGRPITKSTKTTSLTEAKKVRDRLLGKRHESLIGGPADKVKINELLDDVIAYSKANTRGRTAYVFEKTIEAHLRPYFGHLKAAALTTEKLKSYRDERRAAGRTDVTVNRHFAILRLAFRNGMKTTPPKVTATPFFPMVKEDNARQGFLTDEKYTALRDALPDYLKPLFVVAYFTGIRLGELLKIHCHQVDFERGMMTLQRRDTKGNQARVVPILSGDMHDYLKTAMEGRQPNKPLFENEGKPIKDFRGAWDCARKAAGLPELKFHDLRRTAVRNMRRAGVPQIVRMKISGHKTPSMEIRYNIVDDEDIQTAKRLMEAQNHYRTTTVEGFLG